MSQHSKATKPSNEYSAYFQSETSENNKNTDFTMNRYTENESNDQTQREQAQSQQIEKVHRPQSEYQETIKMTEYNKLSQIPKPRECPPDFSLYQYDENMEEPEYDEIDEKQFQRFPQNEVNRIHRENIRNFAHLTTSKVAEPEMNKIEYTESANKLSVSTDVHEAPTPIRTPINQTIDSQDFKPRNVIGTDKMARKLTVESNNAVNQSTEFRQNDNIEDEVIFNKNGMTTIKAEMVRAQDIISEHQRTISMLRKQLNSSTKTSSFQSDLDRATRHIEELTNIVRALRAAARKGNRKTDSKVATVYVPEQCTEPGVLRKIWKSVCSKKKKTWKRVAAVCFVVGMTVGTGYCIYMNPMGSFLGATGSIGTYFGTAVPQNAQIQGVEQHDNLGNGHEETLIKSITGTDIADGSGLNILFFLAIHSMKWNNE